MNVMDGSAVFISSFATMLSKNPNINVDLVLANPIRRDLLLQPLYELDNVNIICPYDDSDLSESEYSWKNKNRMSYLEASEVINYYWAKKDYDWFIIRGIEVAIKLIDVNPNIISKSMVYMTGGITDSTQEVTSSKLTEFQRLRELDAYILCQTEEMKEFLLTKMDKELFEDKIIPLNPMVPDTVDEFEDIFNKKSKYYKLCYTGKFDKGWNSIPMVVGFKELKEDIPEATLEVAGDKFNVDKNNPNYVKDLKYLLKSTKNLTWYGAVSRDEARQLIMASDIGITWRDTSMDTSLELSTKLLEYGTLGKAVVLNPTPMHKKIFGEEYPLYAETLDDYIHVVKQAMEDPSVYEKAARIMFEGSKKFTFSEILNNLLPYLIKDKVKEVLKEKGLEISDTDTENIITTIQLDQIYKYDLDNGKHLYISNTKEHKNIFKVLEGISEQGEIFDIEQIGGILFLFVNDNDKSFYENYYKNFNIDVINNIAIRVNDQNATSKNNYFKPTSLKTQLSIADNVQSEQSRSDSSQLNKKYMTLQSKYNALAKSKLGRIQLKYWKIKNK